MGECAIAILFIAKDGKICVFALVRNIPVLSEIMRQDPLKSMSTKNRMNLNLKFILAVVLIYLVLFIGLDGLQANQLWDEKSFWETSLIFSHGLIPDSEYLKDYGELTTPLAFIIFGTLEYLFRGGIFIGRLLNFSLSFLMTFLIGYPNRRREMQSILSAFGLLLCPYYLFSSGHLYTDIIACFFTFLGFWFYTYDRHVLSGAAFILGIASRQFILAFPLAIAAYELTAAWRFIPFLSSFATNKISLFKRVDKNLELANSEKLGIRTWKQSSKMHLRWLAPLFASLSILGWFLLFKGLAPASALESKTSLESQISLWILEPQNGLYFLTVTGLYFVIPEFILFNRKLDIKFIWNRKQLSIAIGLLFLFIIFTPSTNPHGLLIKVAMLLNHDFLKIALFYGLALLTCLRFSRVNLAFWILLMNCLVMMKAYPWDKYVLPLLVIFWYLKSIGWLDRVSLPRRVARL